MPFISITQQLGPKKWQDFPSKAVIAPLEGFRHFVSNVWAWKLLDCTTKFRHEQADSLHELGVQRKK